MKFTLKYGDLQIRDIRYFIKVEVISSRNVATQSIYPPNKIAQNTGGGGRKAVSPTPTTPRSPRLCTLWALSLSYIPALNTQPYLVLIPLSAVVKKTGRYKQK